MTIKLAPYLKHTITLMMHNVLLHQLENLDWQAPVSFRPRMFHLTFYVLENTLTGSK